MSEVQQDLPQILKELERQCAIKIQTLDDCDKQKQKAEDLVRKYQEDIQILQSEKNETNKKWEEKIHHIEENKLRLDISFNERLNYLEKELARKNEEISDLKSQLDDNFKFRVNQHLELLDKMNDMNKLYENKEVELKSLEENYLQIKHELENCKEILNCKANELQGANAFIQTLKDDNAYMKSELDSLTSKSLNDQSGGNCSFAKVNDRRDQLKQNMKMMTRQYLEMCRERDSIFKYVRTLHSMLAKWEVEEEDDCDTILQSYKNQIRILNEIIEIYKNTFTVEINNDGSIDFLNKMLDSKNQEIEALKSKISSNSLSEAILSHDLVICQRNLREKNLK